jgi:hypothetical protein
MHVVLILLLGIQTPGTAAQPAEVAPATSLERVRRGLERPPSTIMIQSTDPSMPPIFRMEIRDLPLPYDHLWERDGVPSYVRPTRGLYHHEFLDQVTPDFFRATSVYPCCPVLPVVDFIRGKLRKTSSGGESKARLEVKKALKEFQDQRAPDAK